MILEAEKIKEVNLTFFNASRHLLVHKVIQAKRQKPNKTWIIEENLSRISGGWKVIFVG